MGNSLEQLTTEDQQKLNRIIAALEEELIKHPIVMGAAGAFKFQLPAEVARNAAMLSHLKKRYEGGSVKTEVVYERGRPYFKITRQ